MNYLFLRGQVPLDRPKREITWSSLESSTDMWEHLFSTVVGPRDLGKVLYWGGHRRVYYRDNFSVEWVHSLNSYRGFKPDIIVARGGFKEYRPILSEFSTAYRVGYFANHWQDPPDIDLYDCVLVDSDHQKRAMEERGKKARLFVKTCAPTFNIQHREKKWDCCFCAIHPNNPRKNASWIYKTAPKDLTVLQLGNAPKKLSIPKNVVVKKVLHHSVPKAMNKCRVLIAPYTEEDSAPRVMVEAMACNLQVVRLNTVHAWREMYDGLVATKEEFWDKVRSAVSYQKARPEWTGPREFWEMHMSPEQAGLVLLEAMR